MIIFSSSVPAKAGFTSLFTAAVLVVAGVLASAYPAAAAETAWVPNLGGRVRIVAEPPMDDGTIRAALVIDLKPGWTTYWRDPGESGIPPRLVTKGSINIDQAALHFPPPKILDEGGTRAVGYDSPVALPLSLRQPTPGKASLLKANIFIGVCKEICVPVNEDFSLEIAPVSAPQSSVATMRVNEAYAALAGKETDSFGIDRVTASDNGKALVITARLPAKTAPDRSTLFLSGPPGWFFGAARHDGGKNGAVRFAVSVVDGPDNGTLAGKPVDIVLESAGHTVETVETVQ